ncbi:PAS domain S-box/diguanylate cyclase (GGDEF) domain-containing protein [Desulfocapsa sulfexigens DSM 10523]|uniref:PAS domain S-box/diguanylate cyclase (GGDEF) domain-containing protein n=1 Tax=Desulfocapsa sulfexigens (strain DSM 10523 / SB164P1) TaxID=1167006 RepID=M1PJU2_DESSD|nr:GGDEF domain-containing protein [Desulfocapsa sulfexigens]AGF76781.1 PAS domain S-box/diguanylate cyclase (GGDEF) domain-containing protein [Desulfocapsa sulfexigens DSM 10523]
MIKRFLTFAAAPFLITYLLLLVGSSFMSQQNLRQASESSLRFNLEKKAAILSYFHSERENDINTLARDHSLDNFFSNRALGMSMEYGLRASLISMRESFQKIVQEKKLNNLPIYLRLLFTENQGNNLIDVGLSSGKSVPWSNSGIPETDRIASFVVMNGKRIHVILTLPYFHKGKRMGTIIAEINREEVIQYLTHSQESENIKYATIIADTKYVINNAPSGSPQPTPPISANATSPVIQMPIGETPFILTAQHAHRDALTTFLTSRWYPVSLILLTLLALYFIMIRSQAKAHTMLLRRQVEEADRQHTLMLQKNALLKQEVQKRLDSETRLQTLVETIPDLVWLKNPEGVYLSCNPKFERLYGATEEEIIGKTDYDFVERERADSLRILDQEAMDADAPLINEETVTYADDGHEESVEIIRTPLRDSEGTLVGVLGIARNITARKQAEEEARYLSTHDPLTGLFNRRMLEKRVIEEIDRAERYNHTLSIFMVDLDHFKTVNDTYGHLSGDIVLRHLAKILAVSIRKTDYVARYGGEEFIVVLPETPLTEAHELAERLCKEIRRYPIPLKDGQTIKVTASIGVACFPEHHKSWEGIIGAADSAMYAAKQAGRNQVKIAAP